MACELADWLTDGTVRDDFRQLSHDRVKEGRLFQQAFGADGGYW